jgi:hypothetical protein
MIRFLTLVGSLGSQLAKQALLGALPCLRMDGLGVSMAIGHLIAVDGMLGGKARRASRSSIACGCELILTFSSWCSHVSG